MMSTTHLDAIVILSDSPITSIAAAAGNEVDNANCCGPLTFPRVACWYNALGYSESQWPAVWRYRHCQGK